MTDDELREKLGAMLEDGLETEWRDRAYSSDEVRKVVERLQHLEKEDWKGKLVIGGFTLETYGDGEDVEQSCSTCMYYLKNRKFCELPELNCPVEPKWSCKLWRI